MAIAGPISKTYEAELVQRLRSGDSTAMEEVYNAYKSRLYFLVSEHVGHNHAVAEDLVHEVFLAALISVNRFHGDSQLYTWLRSIALHKICDFHRRQVRELKPNELSPGLDVAKLAQVGDNEPTILTQMESEETRQSVHQALASLPHDYQQVLVLKYLRGMPVLAISQVMGRSPKSVEGLLSRARSAIRANLPENNHQP